MGTPTDIEDANSQDFCALIPIMTVLYRYIPMPGVPWSNGCLMPAQRGGELMDFCQFRGAEEESD